MRMLLLLRLTRPIITVPARCSPFYSTSTNALGIREALVAELKLAMKEKKPVVSTTLRSVLSEVYLADKAVAPEKITDASIQKILRQAASRRADSARQFTSASRSDLAQREEQEAQVLNKFLPPLLSQAEVDRILKGILDNLPHTTPTSQRRLGEVYKLFYSQVDKLHVEPELVKARAQFLLE